MNVVAVIQARMGSARLPGKMMFELGGRPTIQRVIQRVSAADSVDELVVATTDRRRDDVIELYARRAGADVFRGSEDDVLKRVYAAAKNADSDAIVRVCGDCPLVDPAIVDAVVDALIRGGVDYVSNTIDRTFPDGLVAEAFTIESFETVEHEASADPHREHVTLFYHDNPDRFSLRNITAEEVYDDPFMHDRTDLRFALDALSDYDLLRQVYAATSELAVHDGILDVRNAVRYVEDRDLTTIID